MSAKTDLWGKTGERTFTKKKRNKIELSKFPPQKRIWTEKNCIKTSLIMHKKNQTTMAFQKPDIHCLNEHMESWLCNIYLTEHCGEMN